MNIMQVSVTERTKEIGIPGNRTPPMDIVVQFLMEAVTLTALGGFIGVIVSVLLTLLIGSSSPPYLHRSPVGPSDSALGSQ